MIHEQHPPPQYGSAWRIAGAALVAVEGLYSLLIGVPVYLAQTQH